MRNEIFPCHGVKKVCEGQIDRIPQLIVANIASC